MNAANGSIATTDGNRKKALASAREVAKQGSNLCYEAFSCALLPSL